MAQGREQGQAHRGGQRGPGGEISRRQLQLLAVHPGQRRGSGIRRQRRELGQADRQRPRRADGNRGEDQGRHEQRTRRRGPCGIHLARPADAAHRYRPQGSRALWACARRHQFGGSDRGRRASGGRPLRGRQRPAFPVGRSTGAEIPPGHRDDQQLDHRGAGSNHQQGRADTPERGREHQSRDRSGVHLPGATAALHSHQIQRARARPRQHRARGAAQDCGGSTVARRLPSGMGRANSATCRTQSNASG